MTDTEQTERDIVEMLSTMAADLEEYTDDPAQIAEADRQATILRHAAREITRLRAHPSPREVALEKALHELAIDSYYASGELRHYCRVCSEEWCPGAGEKHTTECPLRALSQASDGEDHGR